MTGHATMTLRRAVCLLLVQAVVLRGQIDRHSGRSLVAGEESTDFDGMCLSYCSYLSRAPGPLKSLSGEPRLQCLLAKGAEHAIKEFNRNSRSVKSSEVYSLRNILAFQELNNASQFHLRLLVQANAPSWALQTLEVTLLADGGWKRGLIPTFLLMRAQLSKPASSPCGDERSRSVGCTKCDGDGHCKRGDVPIDPWLSLALSTQYNLQEDLPIDRVQLLAAHNSFNARASGYGVDDNCPWPPPYHSEICIDLANQEFTFTDILNMGIRSLEIDPWWCYDRMRMSHADDHWYLGCAPWDRELSDGLAEIGQWLANSSNKGEIVRVYFEDGPDHTQGHDDLINGPIKEHIGDFAFTPAEQKKIGHWPSMRELRAMGKSIFFVTDSTYTHGSIYVHQGYNTEMKEKEFSPYPECGGLLPNNSKRVYCDSTHYGPFWDGPEETGVILNLADYMKCRVLYPAADQIGSDILRTSIFTWASGQPNATLTKESCVAFVQMSSSTYNWTLASCSLSLQHACRYPGNAKWTLSSSPAPYQPGSASTCPAGYVFAIPRDGYENHKLKEAMQAQRTAAVWLNWYEFASKSDHFLKRSRRLQDALRR